MNNDTNLKEYCWALKDIRPETTEFLEESIGLGDDFFNLTPKLKQQKWNQTSGTKSN